MNHDHAIELLEALKQITAMFRDGTHYETKNPYCRPQVQRALKAIAKAEGKSTFGHDWADALDDYPQEGEA